MQKELYIAGLGCILFLVLAFSAGSEPHVKKIDQALGECGLHLDQNGIIRLTSGRHHKIYYSTDGSDPIFGGKLYRAPFAYSELPSNLQQAYISTGIKWKRPTGVRQDLAVIRYRALSEGGTWGPLGTMSVPLTPFGTLDAVSIVTDPQNLFNADTGIYITGNAYFRNRGQSSEYAKNDAWWIYPGNYRNRGKAWEREASFEYFDSKGQHIRSNIGLRINGNFTRAFSDRSLRILFDPPVEFPFFPQNEYEEYEALILRNSGNDHHNSRIRDAVVASLARRLDLEVQAYKPVSLYVNGVYWGVFNLRERLDDEHISIKVGVPKKEVAILEDGGSIYRGSAKDSIDFFRALGRAERADLNDPTEYRSIQTYFDVANFMDHMAVELFFANQDWPLQNVKFWRHSPKKGESSPWRWMLNDLDLGFGYLGEHQSDMDAFAHVIQKGGPTARLFKALMNSGIFREAFKNKMDQHIKESLSSNNVIDLIDTLSGRIASEMPRHIERWRYPSSVEVWNAEVEALREFARDRPESMRKLIAKYLSEDDA